jgi:uncharacterized membrane protein HdeD (DUF308 family)
VVVFAVYALLDGIANLVTGFLRSRTHQRAWPFFVHGLVGVAAAALALFYPVLTAFTLVLFVAAWAIVTGAMQIAGAVRFRHAMTGEWLLALSGALSMAFGCSYSSSQAQELSRSHGCPAHLPPPPASC